MSFIKTVINLVRKIPFTGGLVNWAATNYACTRTPPRPRAFSLWSHVDKPPQLDRQGPPGEYTTWPMLTDRQYSARHLPPAHESYVEDLPQDAPYRDDTDPPSLGDVTSLFARQGDMKGGRSSALFMFFAQWFTDSVLRIDPKDRRKNTSNHNIDLCQIYGLEETTAKRLRSKDEGGKLACRTIDGEEYPDTLGEIGADGKWRVKKEYEALPHAKKEIRETVFQDWPEDRWQEIYATGLERGNSSVGYVAISTLFLREHNRLCEGLSNLYKDWDDERLFQTARMINTVILMKLVVQDYINHIAGTDLFIFKPGFGERRSWYRTPWIALEFDLLYRWHGLVPDTIKIGDNSYGDTEFRHNNALLERVGLAAIVDAASRQRAGKISLQNVPDFLLGAEYQTIKMGRDFRLQPYNAYREKFKLDALTSFDQLTDDPKLRDRLKSFYDGIDNVEFVVGLFAQKHAEDRLYGDLMYRMVAYDAFTQIYTNPLLSRNVYKPETFTEYGFHWIDKTNTVQDLVNRNVKGTARAEFGFRG